MKISNKSILTMIAIILTLLSANFFYWHKAKTVSTLNYKRQLELDKTITKEQMTRDIDSLVQTLEDVHPESYDGFSQEQMKIINSVNERIQGDMKVGDFYFLANEIICSFKDAHTNIMLETNKNDRILNTEMTWLKDGLYVKENKGQLKKGDKILSIGNKRTDEILKDLERIIPAENSQWLRVMGAYNLIKEPYLKHLNLLNGNVADVTIERNEEELNINVPLVKAGMPFGKYIRSFTRKWVSFNIDKEASLGVFSLERCTNNDKYRTTLKKFFEEVSKNKIQNIAIDVRNNGGGDSSVIDEFMKYLPVQQYSSYSGDIRYSKAAKQQRGLSEEKGYKSFPPEIQKNEKINDDNLIFKGDVYILTSANTFSSGNWFAVILKDNHLGKIVGEPTGNQPSSYGDVLSFQLPESGFKYQVSFKKWVRPEIKNDPENSLHPDFEVYSSMEDILKGRDPVIEELKKVIKCTTDNTRNLYGRNSSKVYGEYTKIAKNKINDYSLIDETGKYKDEWIFQE